MIALFLLFFSFTELLNQDGYVEICREQYSFDPLYASFDECIQFLQHNPAWAQRLYSSKERFIRSKERALYSTDFFGYYETKQQISFYYSTHFHETLTDLPVEISQFLDRCQQLQQTYQQLCMDASKELGIETSPALLFKVIKYLPSYVGQKPHYDGSLFSLLLHSSDDRSLLLSPYKSSFTADDFFSPSRNCPLLIAGTQLREFSIYPTPHIVITSGNVRYSTVVFAMKPNAPALKNTFSPLDNLFPERIR